MIGRQLPPGDRCPRRGCTGRQRHRDDPAVPAAEQRQAPLQDQQPFARDVGVGHLEAVAGAIGRRLGLPSSSSSDGGCSASSYTAPSRIANRVPSGGTAPASPGPGCSAPPSAKARGQPDRLAARACRRPGRRRSTRPSLSSPTRKTRLASRTSASASSGIAVDVVRRPLGADRHGGRQAAASPLRPGDLEQRAPVAEQVERAAIAPGGRDAAEIAGRRSAARRPHELKLADPGRRRLAGRNSGRTVTSAAPVSAAARNRAAPPGAEGRAGGKRMRDRRFPPQANGPPRARRAVLRSQELARSV